MIQKIGSLATWFVRNYPVFLVLFVLSCVGVSFFVEHVLNIPPCQLCHYQRYITLTLLLCSHGFLKYPVMGHLCLFALVTSLSFNIYQNGVEQKLWKGPASCSRQVLTPEETKHLSQEEQIKTIQKQLENTSFVPCDQVRFKILGIPANFFHLSGLLIMVFFFLLHRRLKAR